jgi:beta-N-acetylhexosaminidase
MIGHVTLTGVDPDRVASHSRLVVDGIVRKKWNYQGVIMTDDLVMGAIYQHNVCTAVVESLNAGVDLLLVAFDGAQFYRIFACAKEASSEGKLDAATLGESEARAPIGLNSARAAYFRHPKYSLDVCDRHTFGRARRP